jgi:molybdopterin synthase catalytic subunit
MSDAVRLQEADFSVDQEMTALRATSLRIGGIASFTGCARDFSEGRDVMKISFDAYGKMALAELNRLRSEAIEKFQLIDARIVHRVGTVLAGDQIVLIVTGSEHRVAA